MQVFDINKDTGTPYHKIKGYEVLRDIPIAEGQLDTMRNMLMTATSLIRKSAAIVECAGEIAKHNVFGCYIDNLVENDKWKKTVCDIEIGSDAVCDLCELLIGKFAERKARWREIDNARKVKTHEEDTTASAEEDTTASATDVGCE